MRKGKQGIGINFLVLTFFYILDVTCCNADMNKDGVVNFKDLAIFLSCWLEKTLF